MEEKSDAIQQIEREPSSADSEKGVAQNAYPINDEDYVVTFKTWIVVTILASAYGVRTVYSIPRNLPNTVRT